MSDGFLTRPRVKEMVFYSAVSNTVLKLISLFEPKAWWTSHCNFYSASHNSSPAFVGKIIFGHFDKALLH